MCKQRMFYYISIETQYNIVQRVVRLLFFTSYQIDRISARDVSSGWLKSIGHQDLATWPFYAFLLA